MSEGEFLTRLRADGRIAGVSANGVVRGAADSAAQLQEKADDKLAAAAALADEAAAAADALEALIAEGAEPDDIEKAEEAAEEAADDADEAADEAEHLQEQAEKTAEKEHRQKLREIQWFLEKTRHPRWALKRDDADAYVEPDFSGIRVAVLDTGVACEDREDETGTWRRAPSLSSSACVDGWDFVGGDAHADDDHQHGTHIASIIASDSDLMGMAPGVTLVPVKVLGADNAGTELSLVDGIHHAVDAGVDVINMSLSFGEGYVPSQALLEAIERAHDAHIVLIAAAGNSSSSVVSWPAASRRVVAVGSVGIKDKGRKLQAASYSNLNSLIDIVAPGGIVGVDLDEDGFDDGVLAETIALNDPESFGYWFYAGTSQAAAVVSGGAVRLLQAGFTHDEVSRALQRKAEGDMGDHSFEDGLGAGSLDLKDTMALRSSDSEMRKIAPPGDYHVSVMPYVASHDGGKKIGAEARFAVVDDDGAPAPDVEIIGEVMGTQSQGFSCKTNGEGACEVALEKLESKDENGEPTDIGAAWAWRVDAVVKDNMSQHPSGLMYASDGLQLLTAAVEADADLAGGLLAIHWDAVEDEELGKLTESYTVLNGGTGLSSSPIGLAFTPGAVAGVAQVSSVSVDLDGTGLSSSPIGFTSLRLLTLDGSGLSSSPIGFTSLRLVAMDGSGLSSSPIGFHPLSIVQDLHGTGLSSSPLGFATGPIMMDVGDTMGSGLSSSPIGMKLGAGGWLTSEGYPGASALAATGLVGIVSSDSDLEASGSEALVMGSSAGAGGELELDAVDELVLAVE